MSDHLPTGWTVIKVGDVFHSYGGGTPNKGTSRFWGGSIPWLSSGDIKSPRITTASECITRAGLDESSANLCRKGSVIVVVRSGILKHTFPVAILDRECAINQDLKCFDCEDADLNEWLALSFRANARNILSENREGTTVQSVKMETLKEFALPIPPNKEQCRIIAKLEKLLAKVDACQKRLDRILLLLKRFRQAVLAAACSGKLTADWREVEEPDWNESPVLEVLSEPLANGRSVVDAPKGFPVLRLTCLKNGRIDLSERKIGAWSAKEAARFLVNRGDFLVSRGNGSRHLVGRGGLVTQHPDPVAFPDTLIRLRVKTDAVWPAFLALQWNSPILRQQIEAAAHTTAGIWKISQGDIEEFRLILPPVDEQKEIVRRVHQMFSLADQLEARYEKAKAHVDKLTQSILAKAFRGELVPQNPNDEPASVLLERISATEENSSSGKTIRKQKKSD